MLGGPLDIPTDRWASIVLGTMEYHYTHSVFAEAGQNEGSDLDQGDEIQKEGREPVLAAVRDRNYCVTSGLCIHPFSARLG